MIKWPTRSLGEIMQRVERFELRDEIAEYPFAGTYSFARGIFVGERKAGSSFSLPKVQRLREGDFVYCKIMAWEGAFGLVPKEADGCVMSGAFVIYELDRNQIDPRFLDYYFKTPTHWKAIGTQSTGTNVRRQSLHPSQFEKSEIPLPPVPEQRRIVARIEELAAKINEARGLREKATEETEQLFLRRSVRLFESIVSERKRLGDIAQKRTGVAYKAEDFDDALGVPVVRLKEIETKKPIVFLRNPKNYPNVWLEPGDIILAKTSFSTGAMCQWPGPTAVLNQNAIMLRANVDLDQRYLFLWLEQQVDRYLHNHLADPDFYPYIREADLVRWSVPTPNLAEQRQLVKKLDALKTQVDALKELQADTAAELNALLPSILDKAFRGEL